MTTNIIPIPIVGPSNKSRNRAVSNQTTKNLFPVLDESGREFVYLQSTPGLKPFSTPTAGSNRGATLFKGKVYLVSHQTLFSIGASGAATSIGTINGGGRCVFSRNNAYLIITTGEKAYSYDESTLAEITDSDLNNPIASSFISGATLYDGVNGEFWVSDTLNPLSISGLSFATAESNPDDLVRTYVHRSTIYLCGTRSIEQWYFSGEGTPPVSRINGATIEFGLIAPYSITSNDERIYFLDHARTPRAILGGQAVDIGNPALGKELQSYSKVDDAIGWVHEWDGERFYTLSFPSANKTWCYHEKANWWFELSSGTGRHRGGSHITAFNKNLIIDYETSEVFEWDFETYTDNTAAIIRQRDTATVHAGQLSTSLLGKELFYSSLEVILETGVGIASGQGVDPVLMLQWSDDDGRTWSNERTQSVGEMGKKVRVQFWDLGSSIERIFRFKMSDPVKWSLVSAFAEVEVGL